MISVIIPVHNAEKTIHKCLESLLIQSFTDFEAILIENGSSDKSFSICQEYTNKDKRFILFDIGSCNGPSRPRNYGLEKAKGDFIAFLDSDDWLAPGVLEMLNACFVQQEADIVFFGYCMTGSNDQIGKVYYPKVSLESNKEKSIQLHEQRCFGYTCCKAFRRSILNNILFDEGIDLFEDEIFGLAALQKAETVLVVPEQYHDYNYYYYVNDTENSLMRKTHNNIIELKNKEYLAWKAYLESEYMNKLIEMANNGVTYCRYYIFEHQLPMKKSYNALVSSGFFQDALITPNKMTKKISKGYLMFRMDWLMWKIKTQLK